MKLNNHELQLQDKTEVVVPVRTEKVITTIKPHKGHTLFELEPVSGKITPAEYESVDTTYPLNNQAKKFGVTVRRKVLRKKGHVYISALNI